MHTEKYDMMLHMEKTGMWMRVVETDVGGMMVDVVDKLCCASDVVQPRQVDLYGHRILPPLYRLDSDPSIIDSRLLPRVGRGSGLVVGCMIP
uniref:Uncharacterized protein n=1 Tax=Tanacetum cinerariifolium TaxID=118510 RepID=A0A699TT81_TANCI|nr:hypothetical protein [Tanacetum cinerariifolium]